MAPKREDSSRRWPVFCAALAVVLCAAEFRRARASTPPCRDTVTNGGTASGTVYDAVTGLTWQQSTPTGTYSWLGAKGYCSELVYAGVSGWRLPTVKELTSIVDYAQSNPAADINYFPATSVTEFWTSTEYLGDAGTGDAWFVTFSTGVTGYNDETSTYGVRCVR